MEHPSFTLVCVLGVLFVLPRLGVVAVMVGCAAILTALVWARPEHYRGRRGTMLLAICLVVAMWLAALAVALLAFAGGLSK